MAPLAPSRRQDMATVAFRALVAGTVACFMTACIAGEICDLHVLYIIQQIRSEIIITYALCGFANIGSMGVMLGGLGPMAPSRIPDMSRIAFRALIAGTVACFMTACVAGEVYIYGWWLIYI